MSKQPKPKHRVPKRSMAKCGRPPLPPLVVVVRGQVVEVIRLTAGGQRLVLHDGETLTLARAQALPVHRGDWVSARRIVCSGRVLEALAGGWHWRAQGQGTSP